MTMSDPIADMLTRIRNANTAKHDTVEIPASLQDLRESLNQDLEYTQELKSFLKY